MKTYKFYFSNNTCIPDIHRLKHMLSKQYPNLDMKVLVSQDNVAYLLLKTSLEEVQHKIKDLSNELHLNIVETKVNL